MPKDFAFLKITKINKNTVTIIIAKTLIRKISFKESAEFSWNRDFIEDKKILKEVSSAEEDIALTIKI